MKTELLASAAIHCQMRQSVTIVRVFLRLEVPREPVVGILAAAESIRPTKNTEYQSQNLSERVPRPVDSVAEVYLGIGFKCPLSAGPTICLRRICGNHEALIAAKSEQARFDMGSLVARWPTSRTLRTGRHVRPAHICKFDGRASHGTTAGHIRVVEERIDNRPRLAPGGCAR